MTNLISYYFYPMKLRYFPVCFLIFISACVIQNKYELVAPGKWRAVLTMNGKNLPFTFESTCLDKTCNKINWTIQNADEKIKVDNIEIKGDSVLIKMPLYNSAIKARVTKGNMQGWYYDYNKKDNYKLPFNADFGTSYRFYDIVENSPKNITGKWDVFFAEDSSKAIGIFEQKGNIVTGTFATETGDYRYLEGIITKNDLYLSCFDGTHTYLFEATLTDDQTLRGVFYYNNTGKTLWEGKRNNNAHLRDAFALTSTKQNTNVNFSFTDIQGNAISLTDESFKNKPTVIQILGSWCPNCIDETKFLAEDSKNNPNIAYVALAFERTDNIAQARNNISNIVQRLSIPYPVLLTGKTNKQVLEALPFLENFMSFPTTIYLNKQHEVIKRHTGFYGPVTGNYFTQFKNEHKKVLSEIQK